MLARTKPAATAAVAAAAWLAIRGIGKRFGAHSVLDGIDLDIDEGEFIALLGPSGCGKTTLLRILCGIETPSTGAVWLQGRDITGDAPSLRRFGVVFQSYALFPNLSVASNVAYGLHGVDSLHRRQRVVELLDLVGLGGHIDKLPAQLSGGQQQRVALARALAPSPRLLLLDEPLSALDAQVRLHLRGEIVRICRSLKVTTVMVTHDQDEALSMADRVVLMHRGRVEQTAAPQRLYARPRSVFAAEFLGRMNLWDGRRGDDGRLQVGEALLSSDDPPGALGERVRVGIRPELVQWARDEHSSHLPAVAGNDLTAFVRWTSFHGSHHEIGVECPALGGEVLIRVATPAGGTAPVLLGEALRLTLPASALAVLDVPAP